MKQFGDTVRYRDDSNNNFTALVIAVHSDDVLDLAFIPSEGQLVRVDRVPHRNNVKKTPAKHWLG